MIAVITAAILLVVFPYALMALRRIFLIKKIKRGCKNAGYEYKKLGKTALSRVKDRECSFRIETPDSVYTVKLCGTVSRRIHLRFIDETHYAVRNLRFQLSTSSRAIGYDTKAKERYDFRVGMDTETLSKRQFPVILICPRPGIISRAFGNETKEIGNGDGTGEGTLYTPDGFNKLLFGM